MTDYSLACFQPACCEKPLLCWCPYKCETHCWELNAWIRAASLWLQPYHILIFSHTPTQFHRLTVGSICICSPGNWHLFSSFFLHLRSPQSSLKHLSSFFIDIQYPCFYYQTKPPPLNLKLSRAAPPWFNLPSALLCMWGVSACSGAEL